MYKRQLLVDQGDILCCTVITLQILYAIFLYRFCFLHDTFIGICDIFRKKAFPFAVGEVITVEPFNLLSEVDNQIIFLVDSQILIAQLTQTADKFLFKLRFALIGFGGTLFGDIFGNYRISLVAATMLK